MRFNYLLIAETNAASSIRSVARKLFALICSSKMALQDVRNLAASCNDFRQFCLTCEQMKKRWGLHPALKVREIHFFTSQFTYSQVGEISRHIIPSNLGLSYVPVRSTGNGNCLFNSASLALCQNETLADELRLRTCFELANTREFYRKHPVLVQSLTTEEMALVLSLRKHCVISLVLLQVRLMFMQSMALKRHLTMKS